MYNLILILAGAFTIVCVIANFEWFFDNGKGRMWVAIFGREGARWGLGILGAILVAAGLFART